MGYLMMVDERVNSRVSSWCGLHREVINRSSDPSIVITLYFKCVYIWNNSYKWLNVDPFSKKNPFLFIEICKGIFIISYSSDNCDWSSVTIIEFRNRVIKRAKTLLIKQKKLYKNLFFYEPKRLMSNLSHLFKKNCKPFSTSKLVQDRSFFF